MKSLLAVPGLAVVLAALSQPPQQNPSQTPAGDRADSSKPGSLEGKVVNARSGEPVRRVNLTLRPSRAPATAGSTMPTAQSAPYAATTDAEGRFRVDKVDPGAYRLMAERQGFVSQEYGARRNPMMGTAIHISPGQELKDLTFRLTPQAVMVGRVLDEEGEPLAGVRIHVLRRRFLRGKPRLMQMGGSQTTDTGEFRVAGLAPGRYWLAAVHRSRITMYGESPARSSAGKLEEDYVATYYPNSIDEAGAQPIDLTAGQELSGLDIRIQKARMYRIRGRVAGADQPLGNLRVMLLPREPARFMGFFGGGGPVSQEGKFEISGVQPGSYFVAALPTQGMMAPIGKTAVEVGQGDVENVVLTLAPGVTLRGAIRLEEDARQQEQASGKKTAFGSVRLQLSSMDGVGLNNPGAAAKEDGSFEIPNAGADRYRLLVINLPPGLWLKSIRAGDSEVIDSGIDLTAGSPGPLEVTLGAGVGQITGVVQDAKQQAVSGGMVTLLPDPVKEGRSDLYRMAPADQNGRFTLQNIAPGDYKLYAWEDLELDRYTDPEYLKSHERLARKITVKPNSQEQVTLVQIPAEEAGPSARRRTRRPLSPWSTKTGS